MVLCGDPWDADDLAQETFLVLARQTNLFRGKSRLFTYLYGILLNLDRRERRRHRTRRRALQVLQDNAVAAPMSLPAADTAVEVAEWRQSLWARVGQLPDGQRAALVLRFSEGFRYDEIAAVLNCPLGTVKSRIFNGLRTLKQILESEADALRHAPPHPFEDHHRAV
jgi:RNA polymerase sigma-70 factor (ECF subfamily)